MSQLSLSDTSNQSSNSETLVLVTPFGIRRHIFKQLMVSCALLSVNTILVVASCLTQIAQYKISVAGVLPAFSAAGLLFALVQLSLQTGSIKAVHKKSSKPSIEHWNAWTQAGTHLLLVGTNLAMFTMAIAYGVNLWHWSTFLVLAVWAVSLTAIGLYYKGKFHKPAARLYSSVGIKVVPQVLQGVGYLTISAAGMSGLSMGILLLQSVLKFGLGMQSRKDNLHAKASYQAAAWDLASVSFMLLCWMIGTFLAP